MSAQRRTPSGLSVQVQGRGPPALLIQGIDVDALAEELAPLYG